MINIKENERLNMMNHSCAHLLAQAVKHLYKDIQINIILFEEKLISINKIMHCVITQTV